MKLSSFLCSKLTRRTSLWILIAIVMALPAQVLAQVEPPSRDEIFKEDTKIEKNRRKDKTADILKVDKAPDKNLNVTAPSIEYLKDSNEIKGKRGILVSRSGVKAQADEGQVNLDSKDAKLNGSVLVTTPEGAISSESGNFNFDTEAGQFTNAEFSYEDGDYAIHSDQADKLSEFEYQLKQSKFSTCHCSDDYLPWSIDSERSHITEEGYAHTYNTWVHAFGVPVIYTPYLGFPAKRERTSGLLAPTYGFSGTDGLIYRQPIFAVLDDHTDLTFSPFVESRTRNGLGLGGRGAFSRYNAASGRVIYSNEAPRGSGLRGIDTSPYFDKTIDTNRFGGFYKHTWTTDPEKNPDLPLAFIADVHYVSDDFFPREIEDDDILDRHAQFATSTMAMRTSIAGTTTAQILGEYNQDILGEDDIQLQRIPELDVNFLKSYRPFGFNPYGIKVVPKARLSAVRFSRERGYDGWRTDVNPGFSIPFHLKNYFSSSVSAGMHQTNYELNSSISPDTTDPLTGENRVFDDSSEKKVYNLGANIKTGVERVYELDENNLLTYLTSIGSKNQENRLLRVKHTIEPFVDYLFVPRSDTDSYPLFDGLDRVKARSLFTYGTRTSLFGRFQPNNSSADDLVELVPGVEDVPLFDQGRALSDLGDFAESNDSGQAVTLRKAEVRELARFEIKQAYDYIEERNDNNDGIRPFSDVNLGMDLMPTKTFAFHYDTNYSVQRSNVASWKVGFSARDDRGDILRMAYSYVENRSDNTNNLSQVEGNVEFVLSDRLKLGYYNRYDEQHRDRLEGGLGLRLLSACRCWHADFGVHDGVNPDRRTFLVSFTFSGLGDVAQNLHTAKLDQN